MSPEMKRPRDTYFDHTLFEVDALLAVVFQYIPACQFKRWVCARVGDPLLQLRLIRWARPDVFCFDMLLKVMTHGTQRCIPRNLQCDLSLLKMATLFKDARLECLQFYIQHYQPSADDCLQTLRLAFEKISDCNFLAVLDGMKSRMPSTYPRLLQSALYASDIPWERLSWFQQQIGDHYSLDGWCPQNERERYIVRFVAQTNYLFELRQTHSCLDIVHANVNPAQQTTCFLAAIAERDLVVAEHFWGPGIDLFSWDKSESGCYCNSNTMPCVICTDMHDFLIASVQNITSTPFQCAIYNMMQKIQMSDTQSPLSAFEQAIRHGQTHLAAFYWECKWFQHQKETARSLLFYYSLQHACQKTLVFSWLHIQDMIHSRINEYVELVLESRFDNLQGWEFLYDQGLLTEELLFKRDATVSKLIFRPVEFVRKVWTPSAMWQKHHNRIIYELLDSDPCQSHAGSVLDFFAQCPFGVPLDICANRYEAFVAHGALDCLKQMVKHPSFQQPTPCQMQRLLQIATDNKDAHILNLLVTSYDCDEWKSMSWYGDNLWNWNAILTLIKRGVVDPLHIWQTFSSRENHDYEHKINMMELFACLNFDVDLPTQCPFFCD